MRGKGVKLPRWLLLVNGVLLVLALTLWLVSLGLKAPHRETDAAARWQGTGEQRFTQIACFLPWDAPKSAEDVILFRRSLDERLAQESLPDSSGSLYADAYCGEGILTVTTDFGKATVKTLGVGGEFFLFHPVELRCGSLFSSRDLMQDRVVVDENLAWSLFGSKDVNGLTVYVNGIPFFVSGVIHREGNAAVDAAFSPEEPLLIMSYDAFHTLTEQGITCYEIVLPDPVSGYGRKLVEEIFPVGDGELAEYTYRFSAENLLQVAETLGQRSMVRSRVVYPFWENALRMTEGRLAVLLVLMLICLSVPALCTVIAFVVLCVASARWVRRKLPETVVRTIESRREKRYSEDQ